MSLNIDYRSQPYHANPTKNYRDAEWFALHLLQGNITFFKVVSVDTFLLLVIMFNRFNCETYKWPWPNRMK